MPFDNKQTPRWSYSLPFALALMAPFDILASLATALKAAWKERK